MIEGAPIDVAVIGGGPAGLAAATALKAAGIARVLVLEREAKAGGIPRHCGHPPFGMREFKRVLRGPDYAARLVARALAAGVEIHAMATVVEARPHGVLSLSLPTGMQEISAKRVIYATGVRETPRSQRMISGARVQGVLNTGALQSTVFLKGKRPFRRPIIVGSELVAMSALLTCRHARIKPVAMVEAREKVVARWPSGAFPKLMRVPLYLGTALAEIHGGKTVEAVTLQRPDGSKRQVECDGVILSGDFTPESALARMGHLKINPATQGPMVDQWGRCSDPVYFAAGNVLRPVETAGWSWAEGERCGRWVAKDLATGLPAGADTKICLSDSRLKYAMPQKIAVGAGGMTDVQLRLTKPVKAKLVVRGDDQTIWQKNLNTSTERRVLVPIAPLQGHKKLDFSIEP